MATPPIGEVREPAEPVVRAALLLAPGRALDLACGSGRHAIYLHQRGWKITAVDRDADAISGIQDHYPDIDARVVDLERDAAPLFAGMYDLIVCWLYFQRDLYPAIHASIRPRGIAALCTLLEGRFAAQPGELQSYFPGWTILHGSETEHGGKRTSELVLQRPSL